MAGRVDRQTPAIVVVGSANVDLVSFTPRMPGPGETVIGSRFRIGVGGKGANQAVMARRLGAAVTLIARVGEDHFGDLTLDDGAAEDLNMTFVARVPGPSGVATIWVEPDGTNRILAIPGANAELAPHDVTSAVATMTRIDVVIGQLEVQQAATEAAFRAARERGAVTILNPAPAAPIAISLLALTDWLVPNEVELVTLSGGAFDRAGAADPGGAADSADDVSLTAYAASVGPRLVVTLGALGAALVHVDGSVARVPARPAEVVDSTGAGDAFVGAFAYGLGIGVPELDAVHLGVACGSDSVGRGGARESFPDRDRSRALLDEIVNQPGRADPRLRYS